MNLDGKMPYQSHFISKPDVIGSYSDYANIVIIDSKDRNKMLYRNANDYTITLKSPFYDVSEVELISIYYKYSRYEFDTRNNPLVNAPHSLDDISDWNFPYSIEEALYPLDTLKGTKLFPTKSRIDDIWGDKNLTVRIIE